LKGAKSMPEKKDARLILRIETSDGGTAEMIFEGVGSISYVLAEAGLLSKEIEELLGC